jgi:hypothetical protein
LLVRDRDQVIARIEPAGGPSASGPDEQLDHLERRGVLRRRTAALTTEILARRVDISADVVDALLRDRAEER